MNLNSILSDSRRLVYILGGAIALLVFLALILIIRNLGGGTTGGSVDLQVWGVYDDDTAFSQAITDYQKTNKNVHVTYRVIPFADYEKTLLNALAAGQGPDVFMIHNTWLPKDADKLLPLPDTFPGMKQPLMTVRQFQDLFVGVAANDLINNGKIYGMPLYVDTLGLFYNRDMFNTAAIAMPPVTWTDFMDDVKKLTQYDQARNITQSGAGIGTARNINRSTDILMMLMLQSGTQMTNSDGTQATFSQSVDGVPVGSRALQFYTDFANPAKDVYTWNDSQNYNIDAFTSGKTAMIINYSHQLATLRQANPRLNIGIAKVPQINANDARTYADYWPLVVSQASKHPYDAWQFIYFMAAGAGTPDYLNATSRPSARTDLISQQKSDPDLGVFAEQALTARSWLQLDNQADETIFADMIDAVNLNKEPVDQALKDAESKVSVLMSNR